MFSITYKRLVTIETRHEFYQSGRSPDFIFVPTQDCRKTMANLKLRFIPGQFGFSIALQIAEQTAPDTFLPFIAPDSPFRLRFYLISNNPQLFTFSQLPGAKPSGHYFYLTNRFDKQLPGPPPALLLSGHDAGDQNVSANDLVRVVPGKFKYPLSAPGAQVTITESFAASPDIVWPTPEAPQGEGEIIECDLSTLPDGRYLLEEDTGISLELYKDDRFPASRALGIIELWSDTPATDFQFLETLGNGTIVAHPKTYQIRYLTRNSVWRYFVIAQSEGVDLNNFSITNPAPDNFSSVSVPASIENRYGSGNVVLWQSQSEIPFREIPETVVNYQYNPPGPGSASGRLGFPRLENAGPRKDNNGDIIVNGGGAPVYFSEEYVIL